MNDSGPSTVPAGYLNTHGPSLGDRLDASVDLPCRIVPPTRPLSVFRLLAGVAKNPIETWPIEVYQQPFYQASVFGHRFTFVSAPDLIKRVLVDEADGFEKGIVARRALQPVLGDAILTSDGAKWRWQRRAAAPMFRQENIDRVVPLMIACAQRTRDRWQAHASGTEINVAREMMRTTLDIVLEAMLPGRGRIDPRLLGEAITDYLESTSWILLWTMLRAPRWLPYPGFRRAQRAAKYLKHVLNDLIAEARRKPSGRGDLLSLLVEAKDPETGRAMGDEDVRDNLLTFIAAGHETSAVALTWTFYLLNRHRNVEERVRREIVAVTGGLPLHAAHIDRLSYTKQVVQEAMRLYPPAPVIAREAQRDIRLGDQTIKAGTVVYVPVYAVHRHVAIWADPDRFDPERFDADAARGRDRLAYLPFGAGPRTCIGMGFALAEMVAIVAVLAGSFTLRLRPGFTPKPKMRVTLRPERGMPMRLFPADECVKVVSHQD
jgi:cytochrome P450